MDGDPVIFEICDTCPKVFTSGIISPINFHSILDFHNNGIEDETILEHLFMGELFAFLYFCFFASLYFHFQSLEELPSSETLSWADGLVLVYSITDRFGINHHSIRMMVYGLEFLIEMA